MVAVRSGYLLELSTSRESEDIPAAKGTAKFGDNFIPRATRRALGRDARVGEGKKIGTRLGQNLVSGLISLALVLLSSPFYFTHNNTNTRLMSQLCYRRFHGSNPRGDANLIKPVALASYGLYCVSGHPK